jgi:hypothetical protein
MESCSGPPAIAAGALQPPKDWLPGTVHQHWTSAVIGGWVAKTTKEVVVYQKGCIFKVTATLEATTNALGWTPALLTC